ncbi:MAG: type I-C CRISPR-associated endonuclease Cas1 [Akkermansia sp.]|nr:type I-C CRISPR-associated endonuclease Cas1 [Akkermansia sp.]
MKQHLNTLYVKSEGAWLSLDGESVLVSVNKQKVGRIPLHNLQAIQTFGWSIGASTQLMAHCADKGIHISFCNPNGKLLCNVSGFSSGNVLLRRQQYRIADTPSTSISIVREMIAAKIQNTRVTLQRALRDHTLTDADHITDVVKNLATSVKTARQASTFLELLGIEGYAAERYFSIFSHLIIPRDFTFSSRSRRPPLDPVNALLSFSYALLASDCKSALESVGLDSAVGFYHKDRPGRPGLALDLMEEFRTPLADRLVLSLLNRRQLKSHDFKVEETGAVRLSDDARKLVLTSWQERKSEILMHPFLEEKVTIGMLPFIQARLLAQVIRGALDAYPPMLWK